MCPTQANLPVSEDPSTKAVPRTHEGKLNDSDKAPPIPSENRFGGDIGDKSQKQCKKD